MRALPIAGAVILTWLSVCSFAWAGPERPWPLGDDDYELRVRLLNANGDRSAALMDCNVRIPVDQVTRICHRDTWCIDRIRRRHVHWYHCDPTVSEWPRFELSVKEDIADDVPVNYRPGLAVFRQVSVEVTVDPKLAPNNKAGSLAFGKPQCFTETARLGGELMLPIDPDADGNARYWLEITILTLSCRGRIKALLQAEREVFEFWPGGFFR